MSPQLERIVIISIMTILVSLFTWMYVRDRHRRMRLWMLGWVSILLHFAALTLLEFHLIPIKPAKLVAIGTLVLAGMSFLLSVSQACATRKRRAIFLALVGLPSILYIASLVYQVHQLWIYPTLLSTVIIAGLALSFSHYRLTAPALFVPTFIATGAGLWTVLHAADHPRYGLDYLLWSFFAVTGVLYWRHFRRLSPGVIFTSLSFAAWGMVFPVAEYLFSLHVGPPGSSVLWDIPKYFVAFGMIFTLYENQSEILQREIKERRRAEIDAKAADKAKSIFLATMSHEIRTPMNGIIGITDLVLDTPLSREQREDLNMVKASAESLLMVINDILDFSKIEAGKLEFEKIDFDLRENLGEVIRAMSFRACEKGLELVCDVDAQVPEIVIGDPGRLRQVMVNLIGNAVKFTEKGEIVLTVHCDTQRENDIELHFSVRDTGIGIPVEKRSVIFQAFTQVDDTTTRKFGGTGLGLAICTRLVDMMRGRIWVEAGPDEIGSIFHFTTRLGVQMNYKPKSLPFSKEELKGMPVLVVDDNATNRHVLVEMLRRWDMRPTAVNSGPDALATLQARKDAGIPFALILLDSQMPEMDGFAVAEAIQNDHELLGSTIMMLTSAPNSGDVRRCATAGITKYLTKPVRQYELLDAIGAAIGTSLQRERSGRLQSNTSQNGNGMEVLLAEDNQINQALAVRLLQKYGYQVTTVGNGRSALGAIDSKKFDLVLMDVELPELDGIAATLAIREREKDTGNHLPIVAMTAHAMKGDKERCLEAGMDAYIAKPINAPELFEIIDSLFHVRNLVVGEFGEN